MLSCLRGEITLPKPTVSVAVAAIESKPEFQERCKTLRRSLGVGGMLTVLGDGAAWIWAMGLFLFGRVAECLDVFHVLENISKCGKVLYKNAKEFQEWFDDMRMVLLKDGFAGMDTRLQALPFDEKWSVEEREAVQSLRDYLGKHKGRMNYRERLAQGRSIGSGQLEGACKNLVGRRLKQTESRRFVPLSTPNSGSIVGITHKYLQKLTLPLLFPFFLVCNPFSSLAIESSDFTAAFPLVFLIVFSETLF